jgi:uncharacterized protein (DUF488 family)
VSRRVVTIGVYGFDADTFLSALRGAGYAWANAARLQKALSAAGIEYRHLKELAMPDELRQLQYRHDERAGVGQRSRVELADEVRERYRAEVLDRVDLDHLVPADEVLALMCVEREPSACHRSLIAERLGGGVEHLRP